MRPTWLVGTALCAAIVVLGIGVYQYEAAPAAAPSNTSQSSASTSSTTTTASAQTYTMAQVAQHNSASSCWSAINGKVYDLTNWINQHPGGPEHILSICGIDGSSAFNAQHAGNAQVEAILQQFYIGTLTQ